MSFIWFEPQIVTDAVSGYGEVMFANQVDASLQV